MSRSVRQQAAHADWWSRRPNGWGGITAHSRRAGNMKWWKRNTHKRERGQAKSALSDPSD